MASLLGCSAMSLCGEAACCFGPAAVSCCCARGSCKNSTSTRIAYAVLLLAVSIAAWVMLEPSVGSQISRMSRYSGDIDCSEGENCDLKWGQLGAFRVMFAPTVLFTLLSVLMMGVKSSEDRRAGLQNGFWGIKLILITGLAGAAFFIPNKFFQGAFGWIGLVGGFAFLIIQMILLVDFAHSWAESWVGKMEEGSSCHKWGLLVACVAMYGLAITATILLFVYYTKDPSDPSNQCGKEKFFISFNLILSILMTVVSVSGRVREALPKSGLLQSGVMVFYTTYLTWSALSEVGGGCHPGSVDVNNTSDTVIAAMLTFVAVCYASLRTSSASQIGKLGMGDESENQALLSESSSPSRDDDDVEGGAKGCIDNEQDGVIYNWSMFHITFMLASLYIMMVITDWGVINDGTNPTIHVGHGASSLWIKIVSGWICAVLYIWTLVAPICLPDRDFS